MESEDRTSSSRFELVRFKPHGNTFFCTILGNEKIYVKWSRRCQILWYWYWSIALPFCRANLSVQGFSWFMRNVVLNIVLFLVLIFLTTPTIILNTMDKLDVTKTIEDLHVRWILLNSHQITFRCAAFSWLCSVSDPRVPLSVSFSPPSCCASSH